MIGPVLALSALALSTAAAIPSDLERAYLAGNWDAFCEDAYRRLAESDEDSDPALSLLVGKAELARGDARAALLAFTQVLDGGADGALRSQARIGIARAFLATGETRAAHRILQAMRGETASADYGGEIEGILNPRRAAPVSAPPAVGRWWLQMASGSSKDGAERLLRELRAGPGRPNGVVRREGSRWVVLLGPYATRAEVDRVRTDFARRGRRGVVRQR